MVIEESGQDETRRGDTKREKSDGDDVRDVGGHNDDQRLW